jgi:hypothetical protein
MISAKDAVVDLHRRFERSSRAGPLNHNYVAMWTEECGDAGHDFYNGVAAELARGYAEKRYSFTFCDVVVNGCFRALTARQMREPQPPWPMLFQRVYEALDAGEYHRRPDKSDDPEAEHTAPIIAAILNEL